MSTPRDESKMMEIFGTQQLVDMFQSMDDQLQNKILNSAFRKAAKLVIDTAQGNLRGTYNHVSASLSMTYKKDIQTLEFGASKRKGGSLAHIANAGTVDRFTKKGFSRGRIIGNYFWTNAVKSTEDKQKEIIYNDIKAQFDKIIQRNNQITT